MTMSLNSSSCTPQLAYTFLDSAPQCISCWNENYESVYCNKAYLDLFKIPDVATFTSNHQTLYPEQQPSQKISTDVLREYMQLAFLEGQAQGAFVFADSNDKEIVANINFTRVEHENEKYLLCTLTPMPSAKVPHSDQSPESQDMLAREIMHTSVLGSTLWNEDLQLLDCTNKRLELFGVSKEEFISTFFTFSPEFQPDGSPSYETLRGYLQQAFDEGYCNFTWTYIGKDGAPFFIRIALVCINLQGKKYVLSYTSDKNMHELPINSTINSYERMELLLKHLPIGVDLWNKDMELIDCNEATLHLFGVKSKEEYVKIFYSLFPEFQPNGMRSKDLIPYYLQQAFEHGETRFEWMLVDANGEDFPIETKIVRTKNGDEDIVVVYYKDLREVRENIRKAEQRLADINNILDSAPYAINIWDKTPKPVECNLATLSLYGFKSREDYLENFHKTIPEKQKDGRIMAHVFHQRFTEAIETGYAYDEGELINIKDNRPFSVEITLKKLIINGEEKIISYLNDVSVQKAMLAEIADSHLELTIARDEAEKNSRIKGEFLANMSHEIRTPMNGILGLLHILALTKMEEQQRFYVDKIIYSAESLLRIINDILDFSKIEAGKLEMEHVAFSLADLQEELRTLFAPKFLEKNIHGEIFSENILDTKLIGDPLRLKQVFINLIGNAIKFTENGSVNVSIDNVTHENPHTVCYHFSVEDTGIGLSEEQRSRLFKAFAQADTSTTRKYGGTGLGLAISKRIVEMMQGSIGVESEVGKGSRFFFHAVFELEEETQVSTEENVQVESDTSSHSLNETGKILLVEDNEINQLIAVELISSQGHSVDVANNGYEAVQMVNRGNYDIVFMDIQMPVMDGLTAARTIRGNERFTQLPIIAMSAHAMTGDKEISLNNGMNDHLSKPIDPDLLYKTIDLWLSATKATSLHKK